MQLEENIKEVEIPEIPEPSESDTKKRRVESFDESVDWFQKGRPMLGLQTLHEREIFETDTRNLWNLNSPCVAIQRWLSKRLLDGKSTEVSYHRLLPGQQLQFDQAITKELSQVLAAGAVTRLRQEEELKLKPERWLRTRWLLVWKSTEGGDNVLFRRRASTGLTLQRCWQTL